MSGGINKPIFPTTGTTPDDQRFRKAVVEAVDAFLRSGAVLYRQSPGPILRPESGAIPLGYGQMNRVDVGGASGVARLPALTPQWIGSPVYLSNTQASGLVTVMGSGKALDGLTTPLVDGSATGIAIRDIGLTTFLNDGTHWWSQRGGDGDAQIDSSSVSSGTIGEIQLHDTTYSPVGLWQFQEDLSDSSGNGFHAAAEVGQPRFSLMTQRLKGLQFSGLRLSHATATLLAQRGDMTVEFLGMFEGVTTGIFVTYTIGTTDTAENGNYLYQVQALAPRDVSWFHEHDVGVNDRYTPSMLALPPPGVPFHLAASRIANRVQFYLNGKTFGTLSPSLFTPTGGEISRLFIGGEGGSGVHSTMTNFVMASLKIVPTGLNADAVRAEYSRTLGPFMGTQF